jgi:hypothetical protein
MKFRGNWIEKRKIFLFQVEIKIYDFGMTGLNNYFLYEKFYLGKHILIEFIS